MFVDKSGCRGVDNDEWCRCGCSSENKCFCSVNILEQGYKCSIKTNSIAKLKLKIKPFCYIYIYVFIT